MTLEELLTELRVPFRGAGGHHHARPGWIQIDCPWCSKSWSHFRMGISTRGLNCNCWSCGPHKLYDTLAEAAGTDWKQVRALAKDLPRDLRPDTSTGAKGVLKEPAGLGPLLRVHRDYLRSRKFDPDELATVWGLKGIGPVGRHKLRVYIPVVYRAEVVSFTTRAVTDMGLRYVSASKDEERIDHKTLLYGEDLVPGHTVVVCEGPFDVMRVGPGAVCTFGTGFKRSQLLKLAKYPRRVVCYDAGKEGRKRAEELSDLLSVYAGETWDVVLDAKDPGSAPPREIRRLRRAVGLT